MRTEIQSYLVGLGWVEGTGLYRIDGVTLTDPHGDYQVTFEGDDLWRLAKFDDSDNSDGVAEARWLNVDEGETLRELKLCLRSIGYGIAIEPEDANG